jgi:hypothetical protein
MMDHKASALLKTLDDAVITGSTGTNVNDLAVCIVFTAGLIFVPSQFDPERTRARYTGQDIAIIIAA